MSGSNRIGISDSYVRSAAANIPSPFHLPLAGYNEYHSINLANYREPNCILHRKLKYFIYCLRNLFLILV